VDGERCRFKMTVSDLSWPTMALGTVGADFEVLQPPEWVDYIRDWATRFGRAVAPDKL
jgi:predicted DNA-binding transcriptional regulator YafY